MFNRKKKRIEKNLLYAIVCAQDKQIKMLKNETFLLVFVAIILITKIIAGGSTNDGE